MDDLTINLPISYELQIGISPIWWEGAVTAPVQLDVLAIETRSYISTTREPL